MNGFSFRGMSEFLGLKRSIVGLLSMVILVGMGERMAERFLPLYLIALGGGALSVSLLNGLDNLLSALYSFPGGYLSDRLGIKKALLIFNLMAIIGFVIVALFPSWYAVIIGSIFFLAWTSISLPATMGLVSIVLPKSKHTMGVSMHAMVRRIPMALGPIIGGLFIRWWGLENGVRMAFGAAIVLALFAMVLQQMLIEEKTASERAQDAVKPLEKNPFRLFGEMGPDIKVLLVSDILVKFCEQIPYAFIAIWTVQTIRNPITEFQFSILTAIEMATAMLIYIPVAYLADRGEKKPFVVMTFVFFTAFPLVFYFCHSFTALVFAFILRGLKEFGEPTRKAMIMDLAPEGRKAAAFGLYYLIRDIAVSVAAFAAGPLWLISPAANLFTAFGFGVIGTVWFIVFGRDMGRDSRGKQMAGQTA